jgi:protocatechuate 3,4-dioxygenase beta subunit
MSEQQMPSEKTVSRRSFFWKYLLLPIAFFITACDFRKKSQGSVEGTTASPAATTTTQAQTLSPTRACSDNDKATEPQIEGPFYKPSSPERTSLQEAGLPGTPLIITGRVLSTTCQPVTHALLDFWHADSNGNYDNTGFKLRGHQYTDNQGRYHLETIVPGLYPGRTRHIHVKVQAVPGQPILTTQLYFPDEPRNSSDSFFSSELLMQTQNTGNSQQATFTFVLQTSS